MLNAGIKVKANKSVSPVNSPHQFASQGTEKSLVIELQGFYLKISLFHLYFGGEFNRNRSEIEGSQEM